MSAEMEDGRKAFSTFRVLNGDATVVERDQLFRSMAQLYSYVSDRCDDEQVAQYDEVLCQLAELVEVEARTHVAKLLAPLDRAPGNVVNKLANDQIAVAQPLLEFCNVLSDDDLIEIVSHRSEAHRLAIAGRSEVANRVSEAILEHGGSPSVSRLAGNSGAEFEPAVLERLIQRAAHDPGVAMNLRGRTDIDWAAMRTHITDAGQKVLDTLSATAGRSLDPATSDKVHSVVYNRMRNRVGFSSQEWKLAFNQVKALYDRRQLDERALTRFARFGYGHHAAAALSVMLQVSPEVVVKWLAGQDYVAVTVALRSLSVTPELFDGIVATLPWRDLPTEADRSSIRKRFEALTVEEAEGIFELWRTHAFRRRASASAEERVA